VACAWLVGSVDWFWVARVLKLQRALLLGRCLQRHWKTHRMCSTLMCGMYSTWMSGVFHSIVRLGVPALVCVPVVTSFGIDNPADQDSNHRGCLTALYSKEWFSVPADHLHPINPETGSGSAAEIASDYQDVVRHNVPTAPGCKVR